LKKNLVGIKSKPFADQASRFMLVYHKKNFIIIFVACSESHTHTHSISISSNLNLSLLSVFNNLAHTHTYEKKCLFFIISVRLQIIGKWFNISFLWCRERLDKTERGNQSNGREGTHRQFFARSIALWLTTGAGISVTGMIYLILFHIFNSLAVNIHSHTPLLITFSKVSPFSAWKILLPFWCLLNVLVFHHFESWEIFNLHKNGWQRHIWWRVVMYIILVKNFILKFYLFLAFF
jgi:hypothetical protein